MAYPLLKIQPRQSHDSFFKDAGGEGTMIYLGFALIYVLILAYVVALCLMAKYSREYSFREKPAERPSSPSPPSVDPLPLPPLHR